VYEFDRDTKDHIRSLYHGRICHGSQILDKLNRNKPISYYGKNSGISLAFNRFPSRRHEETEKKGMRIGVIGLGIGTIAALGQPDDYIRFYEINPDVESIARKDFYFLDSCKAEADVAIGDGRRLLQDELETNGSRQYDVIVVDAFSGDSIPVHLLTLEASDLYWQHLKENGILVVHISNLHLDLSDVVRQMAVHAGKDAIFVEDSGFASLFYDSSAWVIITGNKEFINDPLVKVFRSDWYHKLKPIVWTDDFSNLFEVVDW
jgi:spermidine synthase